MLVLLSVLSVGAGLAEAGVLIAIVRVAVGLTDSTLGAAQVPFTNTTLTDTQILLLAGALAAFNLLMHIVEAMVKARLISQIYEGARRASITAFSRASWGRQSLEREGALQETVTSLTTQSSGLGLTIAGLFSSGINLAVLLVAAFVVDPVSTLIVIALGGVLFLALKPIASLTERRARGWITSNSGFAEEITSMSSLALELRTFGQHERAAARLDGFNRSAADSMRRMRIASGIGGSLYRDIALLLLVGAMAILLEVGNDALLEFGIVALLILRSVASAQRVQTGLQSARESAPALQSLHARLDSLSSSSEPQRGRRVGRLGAIRLESVSFSYSPDNPAIDDVSITIQPGEALGVVGPSGSGKTTLAQLLLRLRLPLQGSILASEIDYNDIADEDWSRLVALVPQEARLLEASVAENIRFFRDGFDDDAVRAAAAAAHVLDDLDRLPDGFATVLGPRGGGLSGGQRQRVAIARALLGKPELLVLDEPTSALDVQSERLLTETITGLKSSTTMVIVAHRLTTLQSCDRLAVMNRGRLEQLGTSKELLATPGFYQSISETLVSRNDDLAK